jgi:hypothetical protein
VNILLLFYRLKRWDSSVCIVGRWQWFDSRQCKILLFFGMSEITLGLIFPQTKCAWVVKLNNNFGLVPWSRIVVLYVHNYTYYRYISLSGTKASREPNMWYAFHLLTNRWYVLYFTCSMFTISQKISRNFVNDCRLYLDQSARRQQTIKKESYVPTFLSDKYTEGLC